MPPKAKFTKEEVISGALEIVRSEGIEALTARSLGERLGSSARPLFTLFDGMEEIRREVILKARMMYDGYVAEGLEQTPAFKGVGTAYIRFAAEQPKLFNLLFMREQTDRPDRNSVLAIIDGNSETILQSITDGYGLEREKAKALYMHLWIYSHGIAVLLANKVCAFTEKEISEMLTQVCTSILIRLKTEDTL